MTLLEILGVLSIAAILFAGVFIVITGRMNRDDDWPDTIIITPPVEDDGGFEGEMPDRLDALDGVRKYW